MKQYNDYSYSDTDVMERDDVQSVPVYGISNFTTERLVYTDTDFEIRWGG